MKTVPTFNRGGHQTGSVERPDYAMRVAAQQRPEIAAMKSSTSANPNIKPYYQIDAKGNVLGNPTWLDEKDPNTINRIQNEGLVPPTDPRILANRQSLNVILGSDLLGKNELTKQVVDQLGPLKKEATSALNMSTQTDKALALINKGVTGKGGQFKAFVAPYAEALGYQGEELSDAQAFQLLTRAIIGPMRLDIVGPGPVSEWEQKLMQQISGGGGAAKPAAISLLSYWKTVAQGRIDNYNQTLEGMSTVHPVVNKVYKPIKSKEKEKSGVIRYDVTGKRIQ
jgi:hypothetical protein